MRKNPRLDDTDEGVEIERKLRRMVSDKSFNTKSSYSANINLYPNNRIPFVEKHMNYLRAHPALDPHHYIANLQLMTRIK